MWSPLLLLAILATPSTSSPHPLAENRQDFGSANLGLWNVNLNEVYDFFASPKVQRNFAILLTSKMVWSVLGFFVGHSVWQGVRGSERVTSDPDFAGLTDFVLSDDIAHMNVAINIGYMVFGNLLYQGLALLGEPARRRRRQEAEERGLHVFNSLKNPTTKVGDAAWLESMDATFGMDLVLVNSLVTVINTAAFLLFWYAMGFLKPRTSKRRRRSEDSGVNSSDRLSMEDPRMKEDPSTLDLSGLWRNRGSTYFQ